MQNSSEFINAKPVDLSLTKPHPQISAWIQNFGHAGSAFERALQMLVQNILQDPEARFLALSKSWNDYPTESRYHRQPLPLSAVIAATEFLRAQKWIQIHPGSKLTGLRTRLEILPALIAVLDQQELLQLKLPTPSLDEVILLRNQNKDLVDYIDTPKSLAFRRHLHQINTFTRQHAVLHEGRRLKTDLVRIFKNSFLHGGRFYRAEHLSLKSEQRQHIMINGEATTEIDFSCLHINMLYIKETGRPYSGDAYETENKNIPREIYKIILQIILNCESEFSAILAAHHALTSRGFRISAEKAVQSFLRQHSKIQKHFFSGVGLKLQYADSLIAERVLLRAVQNQIAVLPVHDSFITPVREESWLAEAMTQASFEVLGNVLPMKFKNPANTPRKSA
jgi:hypothetical protein